MQYQYKEKEYKVKGVLKKHRPDTIIFDAEQNDDGTWTVQFPHQNHPLVYSNQDFIDNFELVG